MRLNFFLRDLDRNETEKKLRDETGRVMSREKSIVIILHFFIFGGVTPLFIILFN